MSENINPFENYHPELFPKLCKVGKALNRLFFGPHLPWEEIQHPLDIPLEPVTDWPAESDGIQLESEH